MSHEERLQSICPDDSIGYLKTLQQYTDLARDRQQDGCRKIFRENSIGLLVLGKGRALGTGGNLAEA